MLCAGMGGECLANETNVLDTLQYVRVALHIVTKNHYSTGCVRAVDLIWT